MSTTGPTLSPPDPEWFQAFWRWQIIYQSIHMGRRFSKDRREQFLHVMIPHSYADVNHKDHYIQIFLFFFFNLGKDAKRTLSSAHVTTRHPPSQAATTPPSQAGALADLNNMHIAHRHHLVGLKR